MRIVVAVTGGIGVMCGWAGEPLGASIADEVLMPLQDCSTAMKSGEGDWLLAFIPESGQSDAGTTKADLRQHYQEQVDQGRYNGI